MHFIQPASSVSKIHLNLTSSSSPSDTPLDTPSFSPNTPTTEQPSSVQRNQSSVGKVHSARGTITSKTDDLELDLSAPISTLLRLGTQRAHVKAEHSAGAAALVQGGLPLEEYIRWLAVLWRIYDALELGLAENSSNPVLAPTYDPALLARAPALAEDITYLLSLLPSSSSFTSSTYSAFAQSNDLKTTSKTASLPPFAVPPFLEEIFTSPPQPLTNYLNHIKALSSTEASSSRLLAHSYVRYLGDLSGGQFIGNKVKKSYNLPPSSSEEGTRFYYFEFSNRASAGEGEKESKFDAKKRLGEVKEWFRNGMDQGVADDQVLKADLVEEANLAFSFNTDLFSVIRLSPSTSISTSTAAAQTQTQTQTKNASTGQESTSTLTDKLNSIVWFFVAAGAGVALNIYVQPLVSEWISNKRNTFQI
ncbi:uncharacterized protein I303_106457 [Kwoniella dejecticola CBS 10117]|uniref:Heme oxygenase 2 n=1 Tax=Kwoniella dejecticola CBS 10117 TaxID=1296121 RepID=A0A1A5ZUM6_9TREE|nr:uncharacterized protein I303_08285 [Kwoniella dejecticola CBS 10117]OBR81515.1 hypothetical protein I303_08285 [Kwoniella dejecticola CBS 10117]